MDYKLGLSAELREFLKHSSFKLVKSYNIPHTFDSVILPIINSLYTHKKTRKAIQTHAHKLMYIALKRYNRKKHDWIYFTHTEMRKVCGGNSSMVKMVKRILSASGAFSFKSIQSGHHKNECEHTQRNEIRISKKLLSTYVAPSSLLTEDIMNKISEINESVKEEYNNSPLLKDQRESIESLELPVSVEWYLSDRNQSEKTLSNSFYRRGKNRIYSGFAFLPKEHRKMILKKNNLTSFDIKSCIPALLFNLIVYKDIIDVSAIGLKQRDITFITNCIDNIDDKERRRYEYMLESGIYETLSRKCKLPIDTIKSFLTKWINGKKVKTNVDKRIEFVIKKYLPTLYKLIFTMNNNRGGGLLSSIMFKIESAIIKTLHTYAMSEYEIFISVFDEFVVSKYFDKEIQTEFYRLMKECNFNLKIKRD